MDILEGAKIIQFPILTLKIVLFLANRVDSDECSISSGSSLLANVHIKESLSSIVSVKFPFTTLTNFSTNYLMMCNVYTDVGGIKYYTICLSTCM